MKKVKQVTQDDGLFNIIDLLRIIKEEYTDFYKKTEDTDKKINHMMEVMFGTFLYILTKDDDNLLIFRTIDTKEDIDNGHKRNRNGNE